MGKDGAGREHDDDHDGVLIGGHEERTIDIVDYRPEWVERFSQEKARIEAAVGSTIRRIEHVGSTAVPGLAAKPIVDVMVSVDDPEKESSYLPAMERAGYDLRVREPGHRMFRTPERDVHVHFWRTASDDERRHIAFRDRLRSSADDRAEYERNKRDLATQFRDMNAYAEAKGTVIDKIDRRAGSPLSLPASLRWLESIPTGRAWLASLPALVQECCERWGLDHGRPYPDSHVSLVLPVRDRLGSDAVLKLQYPDAESEHEAAALAAWGGHGAVLLIDHAPKLHALLIERCVPGTYLSDAEPDEALDVSSSCSRGSPFRRHPRSGRSRTRPEGGRRTSRPCGRTLGGPSRSRSSTPPSSCSAPLPPPRETKCWFTRTSTLTTSWPPSVNRGW